MPIATDSVPILRPASAIFGDWCIVVWVIVVTSTTGREIDAPDHCAAKAVTAGPLLLHGSSVSIVIADPERKFDQPYENAGKDSTLTYH